MTERHTRGQVVVGVDGSPSSVAAADLGAWEARRRAVPLALVTGYLGESSAEMFGWAPGFPLTTFVRDNAERVLRETETRIRQAHPDLPVRASVMAGSGAACLVEASQGASLVVVGSRGHGGFATLVLGSVAAEVAAHAHAPVLVIRPPVLEPDQAGRATRLEPGSGPVMVGVDGSTGSASALEFGFDEASARGTDLTAVFVWFVLPPEELPVDEASAVGPGGQAAFDPDQAHRDAERMLAESLAGWSDRYPDVRVTSRVIHHQNPPAALVEASASASLLVIGHRGRGGFAGLLLGSVGRTLAGHAHCPVAVVRG